MRTNSDGKVHVNSYEKDDGTKVKEHYRSAPHSGNYEYRSDTGDAYNAVITGGENGELPSIWIEDYITPGSMHKGGVVYNDRMKLNENNAQDEESGKINKVIGTAKNIVKLAASGLVALSKSQKEQLNQSIKTMEDSYQKSVKREQTTLDYLTKTKSQPEYKKLFDKYVKLRESNAKKHESLNKIRYAVSNDDYKSVLSGLDNYKSNFDEVVNKNRTGRPLLKSQPFVNIPSSYYPVENSIIEANKKNIPNIQRKVVDAGMFLYNAKLRGKIQDADEMWKASSHDFAQSRNYVNENGSLVYSISNLPSDELQNVVKLKLKKSNVDDSIGIIFKSTSEMSKQISVSKELKEYFLKNEKRLLSGQIAKNGGIYLQNNLNLALSLAHVDIPYMYIGVDGDLYSLILDVYDFEPNSKNWKVRQAAGAQEGGYARKYYSIHVVKTPCEIWQEWLKNYCGCQPFPKQTP